MSPGQPNRRGGARKIGPGDPGYRPPKPYEPGNLAAVRHGGTSPRLRDPVAAELIEETIAAVEYLSEPRYRATLHSWARNEATCILVERWLAQHGLTDSDDQPRGALKTLADFTRLAQRNASSWG